MMAQEASEASVVSTSSSVPNWWDVVQMNGVSSSSAGAAGWSHHHMHPWQLSTHHPNSNNSCDEDISISTASFTNASNHSGMSADSAAAADLPGELPAENHLWSQVLLGVGNVGDLRNTHNDGENFLEVLSSKNLQSTDHHHMPEPACNYLQKLDSNWGFAAAAATPSNSLNNFEKQMGSSYNGGFGAEHESKLHNLSDLVNNWSIAPPAAPQLGSPCSSSHQLGTSHMARYMDPNFADHVIKSSTSSPYAGIGAAAGDVISSGGQLLPCYGHQMKRERLHQELGVTSEYSSSLPRPFISGAHGSGYDDHVGLISNPAAGFNKYCSSSSTTGTAPDLAPWSATTRSLSDLVSFGASCALSKPLIDFRGSKSSVRSSDSADRGRKQQGHPMIRGSWNHPSATGEGKKKRSDDNSETHVKKSKHDQSSTTPSAKLQVPKVKLTEKITALQQIVAPFGKTDTASVLMETINYIRFLHEQVQLLSNPYMKTGGNKDHGSWGGLERKDKQEPKADLKSRGLCLVPVSCTPQIYRENNGPDYWTPPYRGCLYR